MKEDLPTLTEALGLSERHRFVSRRGGDRTFRQTTPQDIETPHANQATKKKGEVGCQATSLNPTFLRAHRKVSIDVDVYAYLYIS